MTMRMRWLVAIVMAGTGILSCVAEAEVAGKWVAEISSPVLLEPVYARVSLERTGDTLSGTWGSEIVKGAVKGSMVTLTLSDAEGRDDGTVTGKIENDAGEGSGTVMGLGRRPGGFAGGSGGRAPVPQAMMWKLTRELVPPAKPREIN